MKLLIPLAISILLVGCGDDRKEAIGIFTKACAGPITATMTIGTFANSLSMTCEMKK